MSDGFIVDNTYGGTLAAEWHRGPIVQSFWTGVKVKNTGRRPIMARCCEHCGFVELYALPRYQNFTQPAD
jgi:hypothetical protein